MRSSIIAAFTIIFLLIIGCQPPDPNANPQGKDIIDVNTVNYVDNSIQDYRDTVYIPIYSNIYDGAKHKSLLLTATLSIRSTSSTDTTYINNIDYYDTEGNLVNSFIDGTLMLTPMQSIDYVIEKEDDRGGSGANFIVSWGARHNTKPLFQAVMLSTSGNQGFAFSVDGVSLKN